MLDHIQSKLANLIENYPNDLSSQLNTTLLEDVRKALSIKQKINLYAADAKTQINQMIMGLQLSQQLMKEWLNQLKKLDDIDEINVKAESILRSIEIWQSRMLSLREKIPQGILDVKRALYLIHKESVSLSSDEQTRIMKSMSLLQLFLANLNVKYTDIISKGDHVYHSVLEITKLYWTQLDEYRTKLEQIHIDFNAFSKLTENGYFVKRCIAEAFSKVPSQKVITAQLDLINTSPSSLAAINSLSFTSRTGIFICDSLAKQSKPFFFMPSTDKRYHFDYEPAEDLAETGGNCFGETLMFISEFLKGKFRHLCPESTLLNFQLDQTRTLGSEKEILGEAETVVSENSPHQFLQWEDIQGLLINNSQFKNGDCCLIRLSMNAYTKARRSFTPNHIAGLIKLDTKITPYKYIVFEKDFGAFGLADEDDLKFVMMKLVNLYQKMNYSQLKLIKYGEATPKAYQLLQQIKPHTNELRKETPLTTDILDTSKRSFSARREPTNNQSFFSQRPGPTIPVKGPDCCLIA